MRCLRDPLCYGVMNITDVDQEQCGRKTTVLKYSFMMADFPAKAAIELRPGSPCKQEELYALLCVSHASPEEIESTHSRTYQWT